MAGMNTADLFTLEQAPVPVPDWRPIRWGLFGTNRASAWQHKSGQQIGHCGHPTAIRPYWVSDWQRKFHDLASAKAAVEAGDEYHLQAAA
jgi:hypothetical protein